MNITFECTKSYIFFEKVYSHTFLVINHTFIFKWYAAILFYVLNHTLIFKRYTVILFYLLNHTFLCTQSYLDFQKVYRDTIYLMCLIILWFSTGMLSQMFPNHTFLWVNDTFSHFGLQWGLCPTPRRDEHDPVAAVGTMEWHVCPREGWIITNITICTTDIEM